MDKFGVPAGRPSRCRLTVGLLAVLAMVSPVGAVSSAQAAATEASPSVSSALHGVAALAPQSAAAAVSVPTIRLSPSTTMAGEDTNVTGRLPRHGSRTVWVQQKVGTVWKTTTIRTRTTRTGYYAFRIFAPNTGSYTLRMLVPRIVVRDQVRPQYVTESRTLTVVAQTAALSMPTTLLQGQTATATVTFRPIRAGRAVSLQVFLDGAWVTVSTGTQSVGGTANLTVPTLAPGTYQFRPVTAAYRGAPSFGGPLRALTVTG